MSIYLLFQSYRINVIDDVAKEDGRHISQLVYGHLHSVMRKGVNQQEVDDLLRQVQRSLPGYRIDIIRGEPVDRQFGIRHEQAGLITQDRILQQAFQNGEAQSLSMEGVLRYVLPMRVEPQCTTCHSQAQPGEVNGVVDIRVPLAQLEEPITRLAYPIMVLTLVLQTIFFGLIYLILRSWVSRPIQRLAHDVSLITQEQDYANQVHVGKVWPKEVKTLALNFRKLLLRISQSHQKLKVLSLHDPLTNLYNRRYFDATLSSALTSETESSDRYFALLLIDLDGFKPVNDTYGHATGDALLVAVGRALTEQMRESDVAARLGGDEFAVLAFIKDAGDTKYLEKRIRDAIEGCHIRVGNETVHAACSIGCATYIPGSDTNATSLLTTADTMMYTDKDQRRTRSFKRNA